MVGGEVRALKLIQHINPLARVLVGNSWREIGAPPSGWLVRPLDGPLVRRFFFTMPALLFGLAGIV